MALEYTADASMTVTRTAMIISVYRSVFDARFLSTPRTILSMLGVSKYVSDRARYF